MKKKTSEIALLYSLAGRAAVGSFDDGYLESD